MTAAQEPVLAAECAPPAGRPGFGPRPVRGYASGKEDYLRRLRKIEGQVRRLQKMIDVPRPAGWPMLIIAVILVAAHVVSIGFLAVAVACTAMMALMMRGMGRGGS